jgi:hypothetical protein
MMRTLTVSMAALALGLASAASAATISIESDKATYLPGETITLTTTLTTTGGEPVTINVLVELLWNDAQISGVPGPLLQPTLLTSSGGGFVWTPSAGLCLATSCLVIDQIAAFGFPTGGVPDPATITTTLTMVAGDIGLIDFSLGASLVFGATPTFGANAAVAEVVNPVIPEPTGAVLFGLGTLTFGLYTRRRGV